MRIAIGLILPALATAALAVEPALPAPSATLATQIEKAIALAADRIPGIASKLSFDIAVFKAGLSGDYRSASAPLSMRQANEILEEWHNPYFDEKVPVVPIANPAFNHTITDYFFQPPSYGGLNDADVRPKIPYVLDWERRNNDLSLASRINLYYPAALQPEKWPRESGSAYNQVTENFLYALDWDEVQNPELTSITARGTWTRTTPWLPWMLMGETPGHCAYSCFFGSEDTNRVH